MRLSFLLLFPGLLCAQTQPAAQDKCRLEGKVLNSANGQPVRKARVTARGMVRAVPPRIPGQPFTPPPQPQFTAVTDSEGRFTFAVDAGQYYLEVQRDGFQRENTPAVGAMERRPETVTLAPGADKRDVVLRLVPLGVVSGRIRDEDGDPVRNAQMALMIYQYTQRGREMVQRSGSMTNDLGEYRMFDIAPGKYYVKATPRGAMNFGPGNGGESDVLGAAFFPGAPEAAGAAAIEVRPGEEAGHIDIMLRRARTVAVRGRVVRPAAVANYYSSIMVTQFSGNSSGPSGGGSVDSQGDFQLRLAPGSYEFSWQAMQDNKRWVARRPVQVGATDMEGIELRAEPPMDVKGALRVEGSSRYPITVIRATLQGDNRGYGGAAATKEDGAFTINNVEPGVYTVNVNTPPDLFVKSVRCGNADVGASGVDLSGGAPCDLSITLSSNGGEIDGKVDLGDQTAPDLMMITLVPAGSRKDDSLFKTAITKPDGAFDIRTIAPGSYKVYAWAIPVDQNELRYNPDFFKPYESLGQSVQISEGGKETVTLKPIVKPAEK